MSARPRTIEDYENLICPNCNGSGEGMHDGTTCRACGGSGEERSNYEKERDERAEYEFEVKMEEGFYE